MTDQKEGQGTKQVQQFTMVPRVHLLSRSSPLEYPYCVVANKEWSNVIHCSWVRIYTAAIGKPRCREPFRGGNRGTS